MSTLVVELDPSEPELIETPGRDRARWLAVVVGVPLIAVLGALLIGAILIARDGQNPLSVYADAWRGVFTDNRGLQNTATSATPLLLMGLGLAISYRARLFTIGAEGQYVLGAVVATAFATAGGIRDLPGVVLIPCCLLIAGVTGMAWSSICAELSNRFNTSVVISSLLLTYIAIAIMQWLIRVGIKDPESFVPASRVIGDAGLPTVPVLNTHLGFLIAVLLVPIAAVVMSRTRFGYRVDVIGHNPIALRANEVATGKMLFAVLGLVGFLAGIAGYIQVAGVTNRINAEFSVDYGFTAIIVALLGRLHPVGVLIAALGISGLNIGFDTAERSHELPSALVGVIQALLIIFVVIGDAVANRFLREDDR